MKKRTLLTFLFPFLLFGSCTKEREVTLSQENAKESIAEITNGGIAPNGFNGVELTAQKRAIIKANYDNFKTMAYATGALTSASARYNSFADVPLEEIAANPIVAKLQYLDIEEAETGKKLSFYDLPMQEREEFLDYYLQEEQKSLEEKIAMLPEYIYYIESMNEATERVLAREGIHRLDITQPVHSSASQLKSSAANGAAHSSKLFSLVEQEMEKVTKESGYALRSCDSGTPEPVFSYQYVREAHINANAQRGDIVLRKPNYWVGAQFSIGGHIGFVNYPASSATTYDSLFSIDSFQKTETTTDGVQEFKFREWCRPHYVMGLQRVTTQWGKRVGLRRTVTRTFTPITDLTNLADRASAYIGKPYASIFFSIKDIPNKFICSSLVWYCVKEEFGMDISNGRRKTVWPIDIFQDSQTYVKGQIKED